MESVMPNRYSENIKKYNEEWGTDFSNIKDLIIALLPNHTLSDIARKLDIDPRIMAWYNRACTKVKIDPKPARYYHEKWLVFTRMGYPDYYSALKDLYLKGHSATEISRCFKTESICSIIYHLRKMGVKIRPRGGSNRGKIYNKRERI